MPVLNYFDDSGALVPDVIKELGLEAFLMFTSELGALAIDDKSEVDRVLVFLGLSGGNSMAPTTVRFYIFRLRALRGWKWAHITLYCAM